MINNNISETDMLPEVSVNEFTEEMLAELSSNEGGACDE